MQNSRTYRNMVTFEEKADRRRKYRQSSAKRQGNRSSVRNSLRTETF